MWWRQWVGVGVAERTGWTQWCPRHHIPVVSALQAEVIAQAAALAGRLAQSGRRRLLVGHGVVGWWCHEVEVSMRNKGWCPNVAVCHRTLFCHKVSVRGKSAKVKEGAGGQPTSCVLRLVWRRTLRMSLCRMHLRLSFQRSTAPISFKSRPTSLEMGRGTRRGNVCSSHM